MGSLKWRPSEENQTSIQTGFYKYWELLINLRELVTFFVYESLSVYIALITHEIFIKNL